MAPRTTPLLQNAVGKADGSGNATLTIGPQNPAESWDVVSITVTCLLANVSISQFGRIVDSTKNDPRNTVTTDTKYHVGPGTVLTVTWTGLPANNAVEVLVNGTRTIR